MERRLVLNGLLAGLAAGVVAFVYARLIGEPLLAAAIDYEGGRAAALDALSAGATGHEAVGHEHEVVSRATQSGVGLAVGLLGFCLGLGCVYAVVFAVAHRGLRAWHPALGLASVAGLLAAAGFVAIDLVPFLRYPASPPGASLEDTARQRGGYYLLLLICSIALAALAVWAGRRATRRWTGSGGVAVAAGVWLVGLIVLLVAFPAIKETPGPLTNAAGAITYPGFPAELLYDFRVYSLTLHALIWATLGGVFATLVRRS